MGVAPTVIDVEENTETKDARSRSLTAPADPVLAGWRGGQGSYERIKPKRRDPPHLGGTRNPAKAVLGLGQDNGGMGEVLHQTPRRCGGGRDLRHDGMRRPGTCLGMESRAEEASRCAGQANSQLNAGFHTFPVTTGRRVAGRLGGEGRRPRGLRGWA